MPLSSIVARICTTQCHLPSIKININLIIKSLILKILSIPNSTPKASKARTVARERHTFKPSRRNKPKRERERERESRDDSSTSLIPIPRTTSLDSIGFKRRPITITRGSAGAERLHGPRPLSFVPGHVLRVLRFRPPPYSGPFFHDIASVPRKFLDHVTRYNTCQKYRYTHRPTPRAGGEEAVTTRH